MAVIALAGCLSHAPSVAQIQITDTVDLHVTMVALPNGGFEPRPGNLNCARFDAASGVLAKGHASENSFHARDLPRMQAAWFVEGVEGIDRSVDHLALFDIPPTQLDAPAYFRLRPEAGTSADFTVAVQFNFIDDPERPHRFVPVPVAC